VDICVDICTHIPEGFHHNNTLNTELNASTDGPIVEVHNIVFYHIIEKLPILHLLHHA